MREINKSGAYEAMTRLSMVRSPGETQGTFP